MDSRNTYQIMLKYMVLSQKKALFLQVVGQELIRFKELELILFQKFQKFLRLFFDCMFIVRELHNVHSGIIRCCPQSEPARCTDCG